MEPEIEVWDLDTIDALEPAAVLGGYSNKSGSQRPKRSDDSVKRKFKKGSHKSSVLALAWNAKVQNVLASGSADNTVKVRPTPGLRQARPLLPSLCEMCVSDLPALQATETLALSQACAQTVLMHFNRALHTNLPAGATRAAQVNRRHTQRCLELTKSLETCPSCRSGISRQVPASSP